MIFKVFYKDGNGTRRFGFINASSEINAKAKAGRSGKVSTVISVTKPGKGDERFFKEFSLDSVSAMTVDEIREKYNRDDSSSIAFNERMHRIKRFNPDKDERGYEKVNAYITSANNKLGSNVHIISDMKYKGIPRFSIRVLGSHEYKTIAEAKAIISKIQEAIELVKNAPKPALKG